MNTLDIPENIEDALLDLKGLGELITASEWKRAALVWAFTYEGTNQHGKKFPGRLSISEFADMKISGLGSRPTVRAYRKAWKKAMDDGIACDVQPGDQIELPDAEWSDYYETKSKPSTEVPRISKPKKTPAEKVEPIEWTEQGWDDETFSHRRVQAYTERMHHAIDGLQEMGAEAQAYKRMADSLVLFSIEENKVKGLCRLMDSITEVVSAYKTKQRELS